MSSPSTADFSAPPREGWRDYANDLRRFLKFRCVPFRGYYRLRAWKYAAGRYPELRLLRYLADRRRTSLDVGANLGLYTYFLSRASRHVHAFEPNPIAFRLLKAVADSNVTVRAMALTDRDGEADLAIPRGRKGWTVNGAAIDRAFASETAHVRVPARRIDDLGLTDVGFIKVDVEGHEQQVLAGARRTLERDRPNLLVENEAAHVGSGVSDLFAMIEALDYDGFVLIDGRLHTLSRFSVEEHQRRPLAPGGDPHRYVRNFVFLPR